MPKIGAKVEATHLKFYRDTILKIFLGMHNV